MAIKKIDKFNIHENPATNENEFDIENYLNANWRKTKDTVNNNADELQNVIDIQNEQNDTIEEINKKNESQGDDIFSLNGKVETLQSTVLQQSESIEEIGEENASQTEKIENLKKQLSQAEMDIYANTIENSTDTAETVTVNDNSTLASEVNIFGTTTQEGTSNFENPAQIVNLTGNVDIVISNENLNFIKKNQSVNKHGLTVKTDENGKVTISGTANQAVYIKICDEILIGTYTEAMDWEKMTLKKGTYNFSIQNIKGSSSENNINAYIRDTVSSGPVVNAELNQIPNKSNANVNFSTNEDHEIISYLWITNGTILTDFSFNVMIKEGNGMEAFVPSEQQIKSFTLEEGQKLHKTDSLGLDSIHHKRKTIVFNGSENWIWSNASDTFIGFVLDYEVRTDSEFFCDKIEVKNIDEINGIDIRGIALRKDNKGFYIRIERSLLPTQNAVGLKTFLEENNVTLEIEAWEEELEEYSENQKNQIKELYSIRGYKPNTIVYSRANKALVKYTYKRDLATFINNILQETVKEEF